MSIILSALLALVSFFGIKPAILQKFHFSQSPATELAFTAQLKPAAPRLLLPKKHSEAPVPPLTAQAFFVFDPATQTILAEQNSEKEWPIASLTKLMSALVTLDFYPKWSEVVTMKERWFRIGGFEYWRPGNQATVRDLFMMSLAASSNTATMGLVEQTGLPQDEFVKRMNDKALKLEMYHTHFAEPTGLDPTNVSTAREYANLVRLALSRDEIREAVLAQNYELGSVVGAKRTVQVTDRLLGSGLDNSNYHLLGGKTGYLEESLYNMAAIASNGEHELVVVVFGSKTSNDRFSDVKKLFQWGFDNFTWE